MPEELGSHVYNNDYYDRFCRRADELRQSGAGDPYHAALGLLAPRAGEMILDIGCGRGEIVRACSEKHAFAVGVDFSTEALSHSQREGARALIGGCATHLAFKDEIFDKVSLMEIIEHLAQDRLERCLDEAHRVLKKGGYLVITTPNTWNKVLHGMAILCNKIGLQVSWMSRNDPHHINMQNPLTLRRLLKRHCFHPEMFPKITYPAGAPAHARIKRTLLFPFSHLRCKAYKV